MLHGLSYFGNPRRGMMTRRLPECGARRKCVMGNCLDARTLLTREGKRRGEDTQQIVVLKITNQKNKDKGFGTQRI